MRKKMEINFKCKKCGGIFDYDVGDVGIDKNTFSPQFENEISCPSCGKRTIDDVLLTELGQGQLTEITLGFDLDEDVSSGDDELFGFHSTGECQGCDIMTSLNDLGLCDDCSEKLDRDLIRQRDWAYSALAFGVPSSQREELRHNVISQYGEKFELISPPKHPSPSTGKKKGKKKRPKGSPRR
jgi:rubredoxin